MNLSTLEWEPSLLQMFGLKSSILPQIKSSAEVYGHIASGPLKGIPIAGLAGDQSAALIGNKCLVKGEAKSTFGTGAFVLFCTGADIVHSTNGLLTTVSFWSNSTHATLIFKLSRLLANPALGLQQSMHLKALVR